MSGLVLTFYEGEVKLKVWECVKVESYKDVGNTIELAQRKGWRLHTYTCALFSPGADINHYLLFERETNS